ncbi:penicillin-binding protein 1A [Thiothrix subterranea]|uniref:Penicillin-binding protein 1A n=1 Tax=Thiothrix subterranea TaxID=2735563 RepID=A0AA51MPR9_9GAMM|nr:penicillin-binding protein 1A [Thiothrix subterranea]MDQ5769239.1 penicillin-binding protein 1A [Thiothrix subterranea]WML86222.1 penicillin-binding protein 1A [Thiothrix subterranea]
MRFIYKFFQLVLGAFFALLTLGALGLFALYSHYAPQLPDAAELRKIDIQVPLRIYARDGALLAEYGEHRSRPVKLDDVPKNLQQAFLDIEDARFYEHQGVDIKGVLRALRSVISTGSASQGASTITMQLARNSFLDSGKNFERKLKETLLAIKMEQTLDKPQILELYLNKIYLGNRAYGIASAAEIYYGKTLAELTLAQSAMIAGLPKAPSRYNPLANAERAMIRRNYILKRMLELGHISPDDYQIAINEPNTAQRHKTEIDADAPYLAEMVRADIVKRFGEANAYTQGYHVYTTLDSATQKEAAESLRKSLSAYDQRHGYRGAEDKLSLSELKNEDEMRDKLSSYPTFGDLHPALVLQAGASSAELLVGETRVTLNLDAVKWARAFKSEDRRGSSPKRVSDVLSPGEIVRLRQTDKEKNTWVLSQVPTVGGALVSLDPTDGAVRAVMGGFDFQHSKFNRATQAMRQPGSSFKPIVYAAALSKGFTPASVVNDAPLDIPGSNWKPENFGGRYIGPTTLREALAKSRNLVSIRLLRSIGINYTIDFAHEFGFPKENLPPNLTLALGTAMTTPMEMATAYAVFANGGYKVDSYFITKIEDRNHQVLFKETSPRICAGETDVCVVEKKVTDNTDLPAKDYEGKDGKTAVPVKAADDKPIWETAAVERPKVGEEGVYPAAKRILNNRAHYQIVSMMQDVTQSGTAARAGRSLNRKDIAGKTGTTNDQKDAWFCGFTPSVVTVAWVGFDDMAKLGEGETATNVALPMWIDFMHRVLKGEPSKEWEKPVDIKEADLDLGIENDKPQRRTERAERSNAGFQYKSERDIAPRQAAQNGGAPRAPAPQRTPERVEIPEQLF